jgi:hypothetical protein
LDTSRWYVYASAGSGAHIINKAGIPRETSDDYVDAQSAYTRVQAFSRVRYGWIHRGLLHLLGGVRQVGYLLN